MSRRDEHVVMTMMMAREHHGGACDDDDVAFIHSRRNVKQHWKQITTLIDSEFSQAITAVKCTPNFF
jgi:hypothetical protein